MKTQDIEHLAHLARIKLTTEEVTALGEDLASIVSYVGAVGHILGDTTEPTPKTGPVHNVFRADEVTNLPNQYTEAILAEMPATNDRYLVVKKILSNDE